MKYFVEVEYRGDIYNFEVTEFSYEKAVGAFGSYVEGGSNSLVTLTQAEVGDELIVPASYIVSARTISGAG